MTYNVGDPGHVKAHSDLVSSINVELARFGLTGALPIKEEGAEGHLDDHNAIRAKLELLQTTAGQSFSTPLPPVRSLGDGSHTDDHNTLAECASEVATWPAWNAATGGLEQSIANYNGTGERWMVHTFTGNGTFTVTRGAQPFRVLVVGGGGGADWLQHSAGGYGGQVVAGNHSLPATANTVTIGGGGNGGQGNGEEGPGGTSVLGPLTAQGGAGKNSSGSKGGYTQQAQVTDNIDNTERKYSGRPTSSSWGSYRGAGGYNANGGTGPGGQSGLVIVSYRIG